MKKILDAIVVTEFPDGGCAVDIDGETVYYTKEEVEEMVSETIYSKYVQ